MKRLSTRLTIALIVIIVGWLTYQGSDYFNCNGPKATDWVNASTDRFDEAISDQKTAEPFVQQVFQPSAQPSTLSAYLRGAGVDLVKFANRAETRYKNQQSQETPSCLLDTQEELINVFYYDWQYYETAISSDADGLIDMLKKYNDSVDQW
ncbi:MAG: hypothetical protein U0X93_01390 [Anaerolineales bacterium]